MVNSEKLESLQVPHPPKEHLKPGNYFINPESRAFAKSYLSSHPLLNRLVDLYDSDHLQKIVHFASRKLFCFFNFFLTQIYLLLCFEKEWPVFDEGRSDLQRNWKNLMISRNLYFHLFYDLVLFCILHSLLHMIFLYISWSFCKIIVSFFFLFSLPCLLFPTQTPQKPTFSSSWWASFGGGRGGRLTMLSGTLLALVVMMMMGWGWKCWQ